MEGEMFGKRFGVFHGWVEDSQPYLTDDGCLLKVRLPDGKMILLSASMPGWRVEAGDEISAAVKSSNPSHAVALIDHTAGEGEILPCPDRQTGWEDALITTVLLGLTLFLSGKGGLPMFALLVVAYGLTRYWFPEAIRRRDVDRLALLIDEDYRHWRQARDEQSGA
jgi:hypothetical protein